MPKRKGGVAAVLELGREATCKLQWELQDFPKEAWNLQRKLKGFAKVLRFAKEMGPDKN